MLELRRHAGRLTGLSRVAVRDEETVDGEVSSSLSVGDAATEDPVPSTVGAAAKQAPFKLSTPAIIGIVSVGFIALGFAVLVWRWRARVRHNARMNRQFQASYEKYGLGRGVESSNSSGSHKNDPYGSFFEVETEKPRKTLLNFSRKSSESTTARSGTSHSHGHGGWGGAQVNQDSYTQKGLPTHPPGLGHAHGGRSARSSFSFSLRKSDSVKRPIKVQHLPNVSSIKSKGISAPAPLLVANGGPEPWSPLPTASPARPPSSSHGHTSFADPTDAQVPSVPVHPLIVTFTPPKRPSVQKFKQPQPRSSPATPGTSQKRPQNAGGAGDLGGSVDSDGLLVPLPPPQALLSGSDGSLYSRNSFSSSDHGHGQGLQMSPVPVPAVPLGVAAESALLRSTATSTSGHASMNACSSSGMHTSAPSSSYTFSAPIPADLDGGLLPSSLTSTSSSSLHAQLPRLMTVIAPFTPTLEDELPLKVGDTVRIIEEYKDQWCMVQMVGRMDSPRGVVPCVCLQERKRVVPVPMNVGPSGR